MLSVIVFTGGSSSFYLYLQKAQHISQTVNVLTFLSLLDDSVVSISASEDEFALETSSMIFCVCLFKVIQRGKISQYYTLVLDGTAACGVKAE